MSQIAPRLSRKLWPVWCRRAWWGSTETGQNLFTRDVGRRGCVGLGRRGFDDVDAAVGWGRGWGHGWGACRRDLGPDACRRSGFPGQAGRRQGRRWLDDVDIPMEYGLGQRWMGQSRGGMGPGPWCRRPWLWRNNESVAADNKSVEVKCDAGSYEVKLNVSDFAPDDLSVNVSGGELVIEAEQSELPDQHGTTARQFTRRFVIPEGVEEGTLDSELTEDGFLVVTGRMKTSAGDRSIDIKGRQP